MKTEKEIREWFGLILSEVDRLKNRDDCERDCETYLMIAAFLGAILEQPFGSGPVERLLARIRLDCAHKDAEWN
jgi:hypothetical protein